MTITAAQYRLTLAWPHKYLWPNSRIDRRKATPQRQGARLEGFAKARAECGPKGLSGPIHVHMEFCPPDQRKRDTDNMFAACKAHRDGIADAIKVDDSKWTLSMSRGDVVAGGAVHVTVAAGKCG